MSIPGKEAKTTSTVEKEDKRVGIVEREVTWTQPQPVTAGRPGDKIRVKCKYRPTGPFTPEQVVFVEVKADEPNADGRGCEVPHQDDPHRKDGVRLDFSFENTPVRVNWTKDYNEDLKVWVWLKNESEQHPVIVQIDTFE